MDTIVFNGKETARKIREDLKKEAAALGLRPTLAVILVGDNPGSLAYVKRKQIACEELDFGFNLSHLPETAAEEDVKENIIRFNDNPSINGIILQLPLPSALSKVEGLLTNLVSPSKDIDGLLPNSPFTPPVALAVLHILRSSHINFENANAVVLGRGPTAGKPVAQMLRKMGADVAVVHSQTPSLLLNSYLLTSDIIVSCVGRPNFIKGEVIKEGAAVIGIGLSRRPTTDPASAGPRSGGGHQLPTICGDLDEPSLLGKASLITPTPGGIGPLTVAFLLKNLLFAAQNYQNKNLN